MALQLRRVIYGDRDGLVEALENERRDHTSVADNGKTLRARTLAEGQVAGLSFAIALLNDWEPNGPAEDKGSVADEVRATHVDPR